MNIPGIPEKISHAAWLESLVSVGFAPAEANVKSVATEDDLRGRSWLIVETREGNVLRVPFDFSKEA